MQCIESHLGMSDNENVTQTCQPVLDEFSSELYSELAKQFREDKDLVNIADCVSQRLAEANASEIMMKQLVYSSAHTTKISESSKNKMLAELDEFLEKLMTASVMVCDDTDISEMFEQLFEKGVNESSSEITDTENNYCLRRYTIENNLIDTNVHKLNINPQYNSIDCSAMNQAQMKETEDAIRIEFEEDLDRPSKKAKRCLLRAIRTSNYFDSSLRVRILAQIGISGDVKSKEKKIFIEKMKMLYKEMLKCKLM